MHADGIMAEIYDKFTFEGKEIGFKVGVEAGIQEGIGIAKQHEDVEAGKRQIKREIAVRLLEKKYPIEKIVNYTDLSKEDIEKLIH